MNRNEMLASIGRIIWPFISRLFDVADAHEARIAALEARQRSERRP